MKIDSNRLNATGQSVKLDPKLFKSDPAVHWLARVISVNIELYRLDLIGAEPPLEGLLGGVFYTSEATPWYELLTNGEVLKAIVRDTSWELDTLCKFIVKKLKPPNWELFFWMGHAIEADRDGERLEKLFSDAREALIDAREGLRLKAKKAGIASGTARRAKKEPKITAEKAREEHERLSKERKIEPRDIAGVIAKMYGVTPDWVRKLFIKSGSQTKRD